MAKNKRYITLLYSFLSISLLFQLVVNAQNFASKKYYLVDSLVLDKLAVSEIKLIDSALTMYHKAKHDTLKINAINIIVEESWNDFVWPKYNEWVYNFTQNKLENPFLDKKKNSAVKKFMLKNKSGALNNYGVLYFTNGDYEKAIASYLKSLAIKKDINDQKGIASIYNNIGGIYDNKGDSPKALEYYLKGLKIRETERPKDLKGLSISLNNIGNSYYNQEDIKNALFYFQKSLAINPSNKNTYAKATVLNNIGVIYSINKNFQKALEYFEKSKNIKEFIGDRKGIVISLNSIGKLYKEQQELDSAFHYYSKSLALSKEINNKEGLSISLINLGSICFLKGQISRAKEYSLESMKLARSLKKPLLISDAASALKNIYKREHNWKKALQMHELYITMRDSIKNRASEKDVIRQKATYDLNKKEQEIELLSSQNEIQELKLNKNKILATFFSIAFGLALVLVFLAFKAYKSKQKINTLLLKQNDEKKVMLKEIHHRVKNNLQVVNSLLRLQSKEIEDKEVVAKFKEAQKRIISIASLHEKMYGSVDLGMINVKEHITSLIENTVESYALDKQIQLNVVIDDLVFGTKTLVPLVLIINEVISNSLKYAFINRKGGEFFVLMKKLESNTFEMIIGDNGVGKTANEKKGLGSRLIKIFAKQLNGTIEELAQPGVVYRLIFESIDHT